jgi:hypothetical protein
VNHLLGQSSHPEDKGQVGARHNSVAGQPTQYRCKGNLTNLRRILHLSLAKGIQSKYIIMVDIIHNTCLAKGNPKRTL